MSFIKKMVKKVNVSSLTVLSVMALFVAGSVGPYCSYWVFEQPKVPQSLIKRD